MRLKIIYISLLSLFFISCEENKIENEEMSIISSIYNSLPKFIPPPPPINGHEEDTLKKSIKRKSIRYAINKNFRNDKFGKNVSNAFYKFSDKKRLSVDSTYWSLVKRLVKQKKITESVNEKKLNDYLNESSVFLNQKNITSEDKKKFNINIILSFSKVVFNSSINKAAISVSNYSDSLDASVIIYLLEKIDDIWIIKYHEVISEIT